MTHKSTGSAPEGREQELLARLETYYQFECEAGPLGNCVEWQQLKADVASLTRERARLQEENEKLKEMLADESEDANQWLKEEAKERKRADAAEAGLARLEEGVREYGRHKEECEKGTGRLPPHPQFGRFWTHYAFGQILEGHAHVCGLQGFGAPGDRCDGCEHPAIERDAICTCGFEAVLPEPTP